MTLLKQFNYRKEEQWLGLMSPMTASPLHVETVSSTGMVVAPRSARSNRARSVSSCLFELLIGTTEKGGMECNGLANHRPA